MENREILRILIIIFLAIGTLFQLIGYATPGWFSYTYGDNNYRSVGLWYTVLCINGSDCSTTSHLETYLKQTKWREMQYAYQVASEVLAVFAFLTCVVGSVLTILNIFRTEKTLYTYIAMFCLLVAGSFAWRNVGSWAAEIRASQQMNPTFNFKFPYSIFLTAIAATLILTVCVQQIISLFLFLQRRFAGASSEPGYNRMEDSMPSLYTSLMLFILMLLASGGAVLQLIGFISPGWMITDHMKLKTNIGLWYSVMCREGEDCKVESYHEKFSTKDLFAIMYAIIVGNKVTATLSLACSCFVVVMSILVWLAKKSVEHLIIIIQVFILISATLVWPVIGEMASHAVSWKRSMSGMSGHPNTGFPYAMFLTAVGSTVTLVVFGIHSVILGHTLICSDKQSSSRKSQQNFPFKTF